MNTIDARTTRLVRFAFVLILGVVLVSGCSSSSSGSGDSIPADSQSSNENDLASTADGTDNGAPADATTEPTNDLTALLPVDSPSLTPDESSTESVTDVPDQSDFNSTRVTFDITVPAYVSNALQVQVLWGDIDRTAIWVIDESWTVSEDFPTDTKELLTVTFSDQNGAVILGSFERNFRTGTNPSESLQITADQFDTNRWDSDADGVSNLDESLAGTNPLGGDTLAPSEANLQLVPDKTFRFSWQPSSGAEFYRILENSDGVSGFSQVSGDLDANASQYDHRVALHARMNARYIVQACNQNGCVDSEEITVPDSLAQAVGYFKASDAEEQDIFGSRVALSPNGKTMAVLAVGVDSMVDPRSSFGYVGTERVYVFARVDGSWQQQAVLDGTESESEGSYGMALSLSANGDLLAIGSPRDILRDPLVDRRGAGAVYLYKRESGRWLDQDRLVSSTISESDQFGYSVSLSADGNTLAVGANGDTGAGREDSESGSGSVFVFQFIDGSWLEEERVTADTLNSGRNFGSSISLSEYGNTLAVGDSGQNGPGDSPVLRVGAAYVFSRSETGWEQKAFLRADDPVGGALFGLSISIDTGGNVLAVGAPAWNFGEGEGGSPIGATYVFRNVAGNWQQEARLNTTFERDFTGSSIDLSGDGSTLVVSSPGRSLVTIYKNEGVDWQQQVQLNEDSIGKSLSFSSDGETLAVGAPEEDSASRGINVSRDDNSLTNSGAVFLY